jgi:hypothetical protein
MTSSRQVASFVVLGIALGCASDRKPEPMKPASYEAPPPDTTNEPKSLPPQAPAPDDGMGTGPEGPRSNDPGVLQKQGPAVPPPAAGGTGGMGGSGGFAPLPTRGGTGGKRAIGDER